MESVEITRVLLLVSTIMYLWVVTRGTWVCWQIRKTFSEEDTRFTALIVVLTLACLLAFGVRCQVLHVLFSDSPFVPWIHAGLTFSDMLMALVFNWVLKFIWVNKWGLKKYNNSSKQ